MLTRSEQLWSAVCAQAYNNSPQIALQAADGDAYVICPSREIARLISSSPNGTVPTHVFEFAHFRSHNCDAAIAYLMIAPNTTVPGFASHGMDVPYIHGTT